ncbi:MAG: DUF4878 domain-containing protein [Treponema sp.]|nr:DUF4878 domain-containing protein [Treponema sp.]
MKKILAIGLISLMVIGGLSIIGCGGGGRNSPESVVRQFWTAVEKGDTRAYSNYMTPEAAAMIAAFGEKAEGGAAEKGGLISTSETIDGDTAVVEMNFGDGSTEEIHLIRVDGKWLITFEK